MSEEYTPIIAEIAQGYADGCVDNDAPDAVKESVQRAAKTAFYRAIAVRDRQVAAKALEFTDQELAIMEAAFDESIEEYEGDGLGAMSAGLKAVAKYRGEQQ